MAELSAAERADHCRQMAMDTYDLADRADEPSIIEAYLKIAALWLRLAERAAREARSEDGGA